MFFPFGRYNLTWVNCEMGSFTFMNQKLNANTLKKENLSGVVIQSLDVRNALLCLSSHLLCC